jgi:hypothetical protein
LLRLRTRARDRDADANALLAQVFQQPVDRDPDRIGQVEQQTRQRVVEIVAIPMYGRASKAVDERQYSHGGKPG